MIEKVRLALQIASTAYDGDLLDLIDAALADLGIAGVRSDLTADPLIQRAVITYCRFHFGNPPNYEQLKRSYDEQKAQLMSATGYTEWRGEDAEV